MYRYKRGLDWFEYRRQRVPARVAPGSARGGSGSSRPSPGPELLDQDPPDLVADVLEVMYLRNYNFDVTWLNLLKLLNLVKTVKMASKAVITLKAFIIKVIKSH